MQKWEQSAEGRVLDLQEANPVLDLHVANPVLDLHMANPGISYGLQSSAKSDH